MRKLLIVLVFLVFYAFINGENVTVITEWGNVVGHTVNLSDGNVVNSFLAIPFAKPPIGKLRFLPPEDPDHWGSIFADRLGAACLQGAEDDLTVTHPTWTKFSEDCLHLNVYAPNASAPREGYPVMVWIHGGSYQVSANIQYPGHFLAAKGIVVVIPNYRLGPFGFMSTGDSTVPGNMGLLDQRKSLEFVKDNIAQFGGNPNNVTIVGHSAGGSCVALHMMMNESRDLFHRVIQESGVELAPWAYYKDPQEARSYTNQVAERLNCTRSTSIEMMDCLRNINATVLRETDFDCNPGSICFGFIPVVDGKIIPQDPLKMKQEGNFKKCPLLSGVTTEDGTLYAGEVAPDIQDGPLNKTQFQNDIERITSYFASNYPYRREDLIALQKFYFSNWNDLDDGEANRQKIIEWVTDFAWGAPADLQAKLHSKHADVYMYLFGYVSKQAEGVIPAWKGADHNAEIPYVFGYTLLKKNEKVREDQQIWNDTVDWDDFDEEYTEYVQTLWANFIKYGNPTPTPVTPPNGQPSTTWLTFNEKNKNYLFFGENDINVKVNYRQRNYAYFTELLPYFINYQPGKQINLSPRARGMTSDIMRKT